MTVWYWNGEENSESQNTEFRYFQYWNENWAFHV